METERKDQVLPMAMICSEGGLGFVLQCKGYPPIALCQIQGEDKAGFSKCGSGYLSKMDTALSRWKSLQSLIDPSVLRTVTMGLDQRLVDSYMMPCRGMLCPPQHLWHDGDASDLNRDTGA